MLAESQHVLLLSLHLRSYLAMTITLVGSSRELKNRRVLPPIDLLNLLAGDTPVGGVVCDDATLPAKPKRISGTYDISLPSRKVRSTRANTYARVE